VQKRGNTADPSRSLARLAGHQIHLVKNAAESIKPVDATMLQRPDMSFRCRFAGGFVSAAESVRHPGAGAKQERVMSHVYVKCGN
jgi:hypothetical protein